MKKFTLLLFLFAALMQFPYAQSVGDFRSVSAGGNWNATSTWQTWNGASWVAANALPTSSTNVFINQADNIVVTVPSNYNATCAYLMLGNENAKKNNDLVISSNATLTVNGNFDFHRPDAGATNDLDIGAGAVTVTGNFTFVGVANNSNRFAKVSVTTGALTIGGNLILNAPDGTTSFTNEINLSGGTATLNLAGAFIISGTGSGCSLVPGVSSTFNYNGSETGQTVQTGFPNFNYNNLNINNTHPDGATLSAAITSSKVSGDLRIQSGKLNNGGFPISLANSKTFQVANNSSFVMTGTSGMPTGTSLSNSLGPGSNIEYAGTNQTISGMTYENLVVSNGGVKTLGGTVTSNGNIIINTGTNLDVSYNNYNINISGNWINNGTFNARNGSVSFNGSLAQSSIGGTFPTTFNNLTIGNSQNVLVSGNPNVAGTLTINNGKLVIAAGNTVHITSGNQVSGSGFNSNKMIETQVNSSTGARGYLRISNISGSMTFPVGTSSHYMPATVTPSSTSDFSVNVFPGATANGMPNGTPFNANAKKKMVDAIWNVEKNSGTGPTTLQVAWPNSLKGSTFSSLANGSIGLSHFNGTYWDPALGSGSQTNNTATRTGILSFSPFGAGENNTPLPLKFDIVKVYKKNNGNQVDWSSFTELNVSHYEIERSSDGERFVTVGQKPATGNNNDKASYGWLDMGSNVSVVFYRIKAVDLDGKLTYSSIVRIGINNTMQEITLVQNPIKDKIVAFEISNLEKSNYDIIVFDRNGRRVYSMPLNHYGGSISHSFALPATASSGIFNLRISGNGKKLMKKFIVK